MFPCKPGAKEPLIKAFYDRATTDEDMLRRWWDAKPDANPAISTDDLIVIDRDVKGAHNGLIAFQERFGEPPPTFQVRTPSGGDHLYFSGDPVRGSAGKILPGVDVRSHHGYVLAAGAALAGRGRYTVACDAGVERAPDALGRAFAALRLERSGSEAAGDVGPSSSRISDTNAALQRGERWLQVEAPLAVEGVGGDALTFKVAAQLKDWGLSEYTAWDLMAEHWNDRCSPPWTLEELETKVANAYRYGVVPAGSQTPEIDFAGVDVPPPSRSARKWSYHGEPPILDGDWLLHNTLPRVGTLLVVGPSQGGKTFLLTELARCVAAGAPFFDVTPEERGAVLMVFAGTEGAGIENRLSALGVDRRLPIAHTDGIYLRSVDALKTFVADLAAQRDVMQQHFGLPLRLVVLETVAASGLVEKENDADSVTMALVTLGRIAKEMGLLFATSHHPPKNGDGPRGSGAFKNTVDSMIEVIREDTNPVRVVELTKARNAPQRKLGSFTLLPVELGRDLKDRPVVSMQLSMSTGVMANRRDDLAKVLFDILSTDARRMGDPLDGGGKGLPLLDLRSSFNDAVPEMDKGNRSRAFKRALADAEDLGTIGSVQQAGRTLYFVREMNL